MEDNAFVHVMPHYKLSRGPGHTIPNARQPLQNTKVIATYKSSR